MKKYLIFYWKETGDDCNWFERVVEANSIDDALTSFRATNPLVKVDSIELLTKSNFTIKKEISRDVLEDIFVTALEGGSNYWCHFPASSKKLIRDAVPKEQEKYFSIAVLKAVLDHNVIVPVHDAENELDIIGHISNHTMQKRLNDLANDEGLKWCLDAELSGNGDAETSDVVFQYLSMGEYIYG